jgi:hypothetical protein
MLKQITTWADKGIEPDFSSGRWVQLGPPTLMNWWLSGLPGGKFYFNKSWPWFTWIANQSDLANYATTMIDQSRLEWPYGWGLDGWIKGLLGQRRIK